MMKTLRLLAAALATALLLSGCLYMNVKAPYDTDLDRTAMGDKIGEASMYSVLWLFAWGDAGTAAAAREGGLTTVNHMDRENFNLLFGLYTRHTTIVYGE